MLKLLNGKIKVILAAAACSVATASAAQSVTFDIPAQSLADALVAVANRTDINVYIDRKLVAERTAPAIKGTLTPNEAFERLLAGTGLSYRFLDEHTVVLARAGEQTTELRRAHRTLVEQQASAWSDSRLARTDDALEDPVQEPQESARDPARLEEIVVTAQKREEKLQDVPVSIAVLGGDELDSSSALSVGDALSRVPGVTINGGNGGPIQLTMRGVASSASTLTGSSTVGYYLDAIPFSFVRHAYVPDTNAYDLSRVEVLRGPQGTLYGSSSLNGVVRILTHEADADSFDLKFRTSTSMTENGDDSFRGDAAINVPLVPGRLAARAVVGYQDLGGWVDNPARGLDDVNGSETTNYRLRFDASPADNLDLALTAWSSRTKSDGRSSSLEQQQYLALLPEPSEMGFDAYGLTAGYDFGSFKVTSTTGLLEGFTLAYVDRRNYGVPNDRLLSDFESDVFSEEIVATSNTSGEWRWSLGAMYRRAEDDFFQNRPSRIAPIAWVEASESSAVYVDVTRLLFDESVELSGGLRAFQDDVSFREKIKSDGTANPLFVRDSEFDAVTPRLSFTWHASQDATLYASYSEGFRSGFDQTNLVLLSAPSFGPVEADSLTNYEIGSKGNIFGGALSYEVALYYIDWQDVQQLVFTTAPVEGILVGAIVNANSASGPGIDFALTGRPIDGLNVGTSIGWNDLTIDEDQFHPGFSPPFLVLAEGDRLANSPEYTVSAFADYTWALGRGFEATAAASVNYTSEQMARAVFADGAIGETDPRTFGRASFEINSPHHWAASLYVDNITDEYGSGTEFPTTPDQAARPRPRTWGLQLTYHLK